jgi:hypothetical protein
MTSQINPADIDGNYPIAGVSNNTQGMRDNFTNTRTNFQYAADEITDLQNNAVLKAALTGTTLDNNLGNNVVYNAQIKGISGTTVAIANTSGTITIDCSAGHYQSINMAGNIGLSFTSNTWPAAGTLGMVRTQITVDQAGRTLTLPNTVSNGIVGLQGYASNVITFANSGTYEFGFSTTNAGNAITIFDLNRPLSYYTNGVTIAANTVSTSNSTGALTVAGGVGIVGDVYANSFRGDGSNLTGIYADYVFSGTSNLGFHVANGNANITVGGTSNVVVVSNTQVIVSGTAGLGLNSTGTVGYLAGAGGTVSQSGNKSGNVTLNKPSGEITMQNTNLASATTVDFYMTNSTISATDLLIINQVSTANAGGYVFNATCNNGNARIFVRNVMAATAGDAVLLRYAVIKGATT